MEEEESKGFKVSDILKVVGGLLLGGALGGGARAAGTLRGAKASDVLKGATLTYPNLSGDFVYPIVYAPNPGGYSNGNASIDRNATFRYPLAQTLDEHNRAVANGTEKQLESWWPTEDTKPREDFHPSSSAVSNVMIDRRDNSIAIQWHKNGKWYNYGSFATPREASEAAKELLTSPSIGRALPRNGRKRHNGNADRAGTPDANIGFWGRRYYNPAYAK